MIETRRSVGNSRLDDRLGESKVDVKRESKEVIESRSKDSDTIIEVNLPIDSCRGSVDN